MLAPLRIEPLLDVVADLRFECRQRRHRHGARTPASFLGRVIEDRRQIGPLSLCDESHQLTPNGAEDAVRGLAVDLGMPKVASHGLAPGQTRDITQDFIVAELVAYHNESKAERPGYSTLQRLSGEALSAERTRLAALLTTALDYAAKDSLAQLLVRDDTLSGLAVLKQDARDFGWRQMAREPEKLA